VDYSALKKRILASVEASEDRLIERLAQRVADLCLQDQRVGRVIVRIDKPGALRFARSVAVEIDRCREKRDHPKGSAAGRGPGAAKRTGGGA
jgi:dihydroneopterin aldolase